MSLDKDTVPMYPMCISLGGKEFKCAWPEPEITDKNSIVEWQWLYEHFKRYCKGNRTIVTAGGFLGIYPIAWSLYFDEVCTCEPDRLNYIFLSENMKMSDNIYHSWSAYGEKSGFCELNRNLSPTSAANMFAHNMGSSRIVDSEDGSVPIVSIDSLDLLDVDAIQLDVEGFELPVIRGALKTIETYWPVISVETCVPGLKKLLWKLGYREVAHNVEFNGDKVFVKTEEKRHVIG